MVTSHKVDANIACRALSVNQTCPAEILLFGGAAAEDVTMWHALVPALELTLFFQGHIVVRVCAAIGDKERMEVISIKTAIVVVIAGLVLHNAACIWCGVTIKNNIYRTSVGTHEFAL